MRTAYRASVYKYGEQYKIVWIKAPTCKTEHLTFGIDPDIAFADPNTILQNIDNNLQNEEKYAKESCNIARAKGKVTELALCNEFEYFVTLTIDRTKQDRSDLTAYIKALGNWIGNFNKKYDTALKYVLIPEQHKDGKSWHMHGLFQGVPIEALETNQYGYKDMPYYRKRFGYISLSPIKDKVKCARYITKYITKTLDKECALIGEKGKHLYFHSRGLKGREKIIDLERQEIPKEAYETEYAFVMWCDKSPIGIDESTGEIKISLQ